jgi:aryl-alcohol dehydrogenase-like predicted oxidoreductase
MSDLPTAMLGRTGLTVTRLGYGAMELRGAGGWRGREVGPEQATEILNKVLDAGINFIDTSPDYGRSEELIGAAISQRRDEYFLASKCGCPVNLPPAAPGERNAHIFTRENVRAGVEQSLRRMKTDYLDLVQFHASPARAVLEENDSLAELEDLRREGKIRFFGMSGTLPHLPDQIAMGVFDAFQIPYSAVEPEHDACMAEAARAGAGVIVRGGVARGIPAIQNPDLDRVPERMRAAFVRRRDLWELANADGLLDDMTRMEFMLRYTISHPHMSTTIVGTGNPKHLDDNLRAARKGPLPEGLYTEARQRFEAAAAEWHGGQG